MHNSNSENLKNNYNLWGNSNDNMPQQQQSQLLPQQQQQQQQRITNWIADTNKSQQQQQQQQHLNQNNNHNNNKFSSCNNIMPQHQLQQNYLHSQYTSYPQQNAVASTTTLPSINYYGYQQQSPQQSQQHHLQQQQQQQQTQPPLHSPYAVAAPQQQQQQHLLHTSQHLQQQQQPQLITMDDIRQRENCTTISINTTNTLTTSTIPDLLHNLEEEDGFLQNTNESFDAIYQARFYIPPLASFLSSPTIPTAAVSTFPDYTGVIKTETEEDSQASFMTTDNSSANNTDYNYQNILNARGNTSLSDSATSSPNGFPANNTDILTIGQTVNTSNYTTNNETTSRRNRGGRRPIKTFQNISPEEEEKRRIRRERNKLAAARCRQRRVEQTQSLLKEVEKWEQRRYALHKELEDLNVEKNECISWLKEHCQLCPRLHQQLFGNNQNSNRQPHDSSPIDLKPNLIDINKNSGSSSRQV